MTADEIVIGKGRVIGILAEVSYENGLPNYKHESPLSTIAVSDNSWNTDLEHSHPVVYDGNGNMVTMPKTITVRSVLEFGADYEFVMRRVKKESTAVLKETRPRQFKEEDD